MPDGRSVPQANMSLVQSIPLRRLPPSMKHKRKAGTRLPKKSLRTRQRVFSRKRTYRSHSRMQLCQVEERFGNTKGATKNFASKKKLAFSSAWPATGASLNACGTNTIGNVFFSNK